MWRKEYVCSVEQPIRVKQNVYRFSVAVMRTVRESIRWRNVASVRRKSMLPAVHGLFKARHRMKGRADMWMGFCVAMLLFLGVGISSATRAKNDVQDYLVAGRSVSPLAAGLSAVASNNSGFMFIGAIGFTYTYGLAAIWLFFAWIAGDYLSWRVVHARLRRFSEEREANSVAGFLAHDGDRPERFLQLLLGALTVMFLALYAAAQLKAGGKALQTTLEWPPSAGISIGAILVVAYSFAGGIRASIWTDVAQSLVMIVAMAMLVIVCHAQVTPLSGLASSLAAIDPRLLEWTPSDATLGLAPYAFGWFIAGFGGVGQPHIIVRAMTLDRESNLPTMRRTYFIWYIGFSVATFLVGLYARVHFESQNLASTFDAETALPLLAMAHLPGWLVGLILAALFAATLSTADSQVLACSASITQDLANRWRNNYLASKTATVGVVCFAFGIAWAGPDSVFVLVTIAWGLMMTSFAPLMLARVQNWQIEPTRYAVAMFAGLVSMWLWSATLALGNAVYDGTIGFIVTFVLTYALRTREVAAR